VGFGRINKEWGFMKNCDSRGHVIAMCAGEPVKSLQDPVVSLFVGKLDEFKKSKAQVDHPGFLYVSKFCVECGQKLDFDEATNEWESIMDGNRVC
jgi:hypothetical protein